MYSPTFGSHVLPRASGIDPIMSLNRVFSHLGRRNYSLVAIFRTLCDPHNYLIVDHYFRRTVLNC